MRVRFIAVQFAVLLVLAGSVHAEENLGLVIIAHGAPAPAWNQPVLNLQEEVTDLMTKERPDLFRSIRVALMEFVEPSIATVISEMEKEGITRVYALPLFIAPSSHNLYDIPAILGLYSDNNIVSVLRDEGITIVATDLKITLGPTLAVDVIQEIALDRLQEMSVDLDSAAIVILAHGDRDFEPVWISLARQVGSSLCANTGIEYFDYGFIGMGQGFRSEGVPAIFRALENHQEVSVLGLYMVSSIEGIARRSFTGTPHGAATFDEMFADAKVKFASRGLLPDSRVARWIINTAAAWAETVNR
jgi:hypothetical protein